MNIKNKTRLRMIAQDNLLAKFEYKFFNDDSYSGTQFYNDTQLVFAMRNKL